MAANLTISGTEFQSQVLESDIPVLVDFWAPWCQPCLRIGPAVEEVATDFAGKAKVFKLNVDEEPDIASSYGVMSIPALLIFKGGKVVDQQVGQATKPAISDLINRNL